MLEKLLKGIFGSKHDRDVRRVAPLVDEINRFATDYRDLGDEALRAKTGEFRGRLTNALE